jgi:hypothetical protein
MESIAIERPCTVSYEFPIKKQQKNDKDKSSPLQKHIMNSVFHEIDNAITHINYLKISRIDLNESITAPSRIEFMRENIQKVVNIYNELNFKNPETLEISFEIIQRCIINKNFDINISKTSNDEILIFKRKGRDFSNILIDEDGDVKFMFITTKLGNQRTAYFSKSKGLDFDKIIDLFM